LLFSLHQRHGSTLVLITHDERLAARCGRIVSIKDGQVYEGHTDEGPIHEGQAEPMRKQAEALA